MNTGQAMSDEQAVKKVYQDAQAVWTSRGWRILASIPGIGTEEIGRTSSGHVPEAEAWADARSKLPPAASPEADCPVCAPNPCIGGAHRNAMIEDGIIVPSQPRAVELPTPEQWQTALELLREYQPSHTGCKKFLWQHSTPITFDIPEGTLCDHRCPTCQRLDQSKLLEGK